MGTLLVLGDSAGEDDAIGLTGRAHFLFDARAVRSVTNDQPRQELR